MNPFDPAWLDRMYNNRALVPDHPAYFARWAENSQAVRKRLPCQVDVPYGDGAGEMLDVFPAGGFGTQGVKPGQGAPVLVFIHGGYWRALDKSEHSFVAPPFTRPAPASWCPTTPCAPR
jgi:arylformamidase